MTKMRCTPPASRRRRNSKPGSTPCATTWSSASVSAIRICRSAWRTRAASIAGHRLPGARRRPGFLGTATGRSGVGLAAPDRVPGAAARAHPDAGPVARLYCAAGPALVPARAAAGCRQGACDRALAADPCGHTRPAGGGRRHASDGIGGAGLGRRAHPGATGAGRADRGGARR